MAIYTTLFLCNPQELKAGFAEWRSPLPKPVKRTFKNPFTGETTTIETCEPEWPDGQDAEVLNREYRVIKRTGNYQDYLEGRLPEFIQEQPHWAAKGLTEIELSPLAEALGVKPSFECPLYGPPSSSATLQEFPPDMLSKLASLDERGARSMATKWAATLSTREYTHSTSGVKSNDGWSQIDALAVLQPIVDLAQRATAAQRLYLLIEV